MNSEVLIKQKVIILTADDVPVDGIAEPATNLRYRFPSLAAKERKLKPLKADYVRLIVQYAGICGTDVHLVQSNPNTGYVLTSAPASIPKKGRVIGHEAVGKVIATGSGVTHVKPGDQIAIASVVHCMYCDACRRGSFNQCHNAELLGLETDGIYGDIVDIPANLAHDISDKIESEDDIRAFTCLEPAATAMLGCETANVKAGDVVVIFGGGPIGLLAAIICKRVLGASRTVVVEPQPYRRQLAKQWIDEVYDVENYLEAESSTVDVVIEASGQLENISRVFKRINPNGRVVLLARNGEALHLDMIDHMITQAITISACRGHLGGYFSKVVSLYKSGTLPLGAIITSTVDGLDGLLQILSYPEEIAKNHCKILVKFQ